MLNTHESDDGSRGRKSRAYDRENETEEERNGTRVCVFHFNFLSTPHFLEIGTTFDFDTGAALKEIEMFFFVT